jgi:hypothetical protein
MCAAPLDFPGGAAPTMRCSYCENTVIVPEELRGGASSSSSSNGAAVESFGGGLAPVIDQALKMAEMAQLLRSGNKIAAIKLYRETFGGGLKEAKEAVERIERGEPISLRQATIEGRSAAAQSLPRPAPGMGAINQKQGGGGGRCLIVGVILIVAVTGAIILFGGGAAYFVSRQALQPNAPTVPSAGSSASGFANVALEFGKEGIGAGQFKDARSVSVDGEGRIYVGEYIGGRIQVFDAQGKFLTQWMVDAKRPLSGMAADRKGVVYVVQGGSILRYKGATGESLGEVARRGPDFNQTYSDVFVALDGSLYAIASRYYIVHIGTDGAIKSIIDAREKTGEDISLERVATSGRGDIYAVDRSEESVFKFAANGKYISRFGGEGDQPGQLKSPEGIAVDGEGRVYVADIGRGIQVFDAGGRYLDSFAKGEVIFELVINDRNEIFASQRNRHKIVKYAPGKS